MTRGPDALRNMEKLDRAMPAGVMFDEMAVGRIGGGSGKVIIPQQHVKRRLHLFAVTHTKVSARRKQLLDVVPWSGDDRDAASHGLEHPDGRDARQ